MVHLTPYISRFLVKKCDLFQFTGFFVVKNITLQFCTIVQREWGQRICNTLFQGWFFFSHLTDFSYFPLINIFWKLQDMVRTEIKRTFLKDGFSYFHWFSVILFSSQNRHCFLDRDLILGTWEPDSSLYTVVPPLKSHTKTSPIVRSDLRCTEIVKYYWILPLKRGQILNAEMMIL
jgi:hypothetical protein